MTETPLRNRGKVGGPRPRWLPARLAGLRSETGTARTMTFDVPEWPGHQAGQHVDLRLTAADGYSTERSYSIAAPADDARVSITVQEVGTGEVSPYLVENMELGDALEMRGPIGGWFVWSPSPEAPVEQPILLVAGGSGVVPLMAMVRERARSGSRAPFRLVYSVRDPGQVLFAPELAQHAQDEGVQVDLVYSRETPKDFARPAGRITARDLATPPDAGWPDDPPPRAYVCGPTAFVEHAIRTLLDLGYTNHNIRAERFGPSGG
ncbi:MAG: oxidoreductase [Marmoricola sp.]|nr:oxidoreductase [Marmoricola sp.]